MIATAARAAGSNSADQFEGGVGVVDVVVGELLALQLARGGHAGPGVAGQVEGRPSGAGFRHSASALDSLPPTARYSGVVVADRPARTSWRSRVIGGGPRIGLLRQLLAQGERRCRRHWRPWRRGSPRNRRHRRTTATSSWFLAAARIMAGPPMSIFSMAFVPVGALRRRSPRRDRD